MAAGVPGMFPSDAHILVLEVILCTSALKAVRWISEESGAGV